MPAFERTFDYNLVRQILTHRRIYPHITDDGSPAAADYRPVESEAVWYVLARYDGELLGVWVFHPHNAVCWEVHTCLLPSAWGRKAITAARALPEWIWAHSGCRRIVTNVPESNRLALRFAIAAGMREFGVNEKSFLKDGKLQDQIMLGLSRPEEN